MNRGIRPRRLVAGIMRVVEFMVLISPVILELFIDVMLLNTRLR
jgi:hypothetical protein